MSYTIINLVAVALAAVASLALSRRSWRLSLPVFVVLALLTVVFDSLMIQADLFRFPPANNSGLRLWHAPVEDLAWPAVAALLIPALWQRLGPSHEPPPIGAGE